MTPHTRRPAAAAASLGALTLLVGCAGDGPLNQTGRTILADLERQGISLDDAAPPAGAAAEPGRTAGITGELSLPDLWRLAEERSADLAAAKARVGAAAGRAWQASLYPNPTLEAAAEEIPFDGGLGRSVNTIGITQPIVLGDRRRAAVAAAQAEQAAEAAALEQTRRRVLAEVAALHARILTASTSEGLYGELRQLAEGTLANARGRFEARAAPETEVIRPQIEVYQLDLALARLRAERDAALRELSALLGGLPLRAEQVAGELEARPSALDLAALEAGVRSGHPALVTADREIDAAEARLRQVRAERVPDLELRIAVGEDGSENEAIAELGAGMTLPLWDNRQGDILAARFDLMRAREERLGREAELVRSLAAAHGQYEAARVQIAALADQVLPAAERAFSQTTEAYRGGRASFIDVLDAQRTLAEARTTLTELIGAAALARAQLVGIAGLPSAGQPAETRPDVQNPELSQQQRPLDAEEDQ